MTTTTINLGLQYTVILDKSGATVYGALYGGRGGGVYLVGVLPDGVITDELTNRPSDRQKRIRDM